ncbi:MAG: DUF202 domain-containing protein [Planctomycetota bacterium]
MRKNASRVSTSDSHDRRDHLALIRTDLANERTLLAYVRTSLMSAGSGLTLIKFFADIRWAISVGWCFVVVGTLIALIGVVRFLRLRSSL